MQYCQFDHQKLYIKKFDRTKANTVSCGAEHHWPHAHDKCTLLYYSGDSGYHYTGLALALEIWVQ